VGSDDLGGALDRRRRDEPDHGGLDLVRADGQARRADQIRGQRGAGRQVRIGVDAQRQRAAVAGLASMATPPARAALRTLFSKKLDVDLRATIALALAQTGDDEARPLLLVEARRLLGPRALKAACQEALRRLDARAATGGPAPATAANGDNDDD